MLDTIRDNRKKLGLYIQKGEFEQAEDFVSEIIRTNPEGPEGYLLMAHYYTEIGNKELALKWIDETLQRGPEDELVLGLVILMYNEFNYDLLKKMELIEVGIRLYPENSFFHEQYALANQNINVDVSIASYKEAIRLSPQDDGILANYAKYLYQLSRFDEAEKYEKLALQSNMENSDNFLSFAYIAFQLKRYKKAQLLIQDAIRLDPNNPEIRRYYKEIYPTKNALVRLKTEINWFITWKICGIPSNFILNTFSFLKLHKLYKPSISQTIIVLLVPLLELIGLFFLIGKSAAITLLGIYILFNYICSKIAYSILKKVGFTDESEVSPKRRAKLNSQMALYEMKAVVSNQYEQPKQEQTILTSDELEAQLSKIWESENIAEIRETTPVKVVTTDTVETTETAEKVGIIEAETTETAKNVGIIETTETIQEDHLETNVSSKPQEHIEIEWPKEHSNWPKYVTFVILITCIMIRFVPGVIEEQTKPKPLPLETQASINKMQETQKSNSGSAIEEKNTEAVNKFIESSKDGSIDETLPLIVSKDYIPIIRENNNHPLLKQIGDAKIEKVSTSQTNFTKSYFLIVYDAKDIKAIVEVNIGMITHIYADNWNQSEDEKAEYNKLLKEFE